MSAIAAARKYTSDPSKANEIREFMRAIAETQNPDYLNVIATLAVALQIAELRLHGLSVETFEA